MTHSQAATLGGSERVFLFPISPKGEPMGQLTQFYKTMSSLEIAELTGKQHFHVCRDIEEQLGRLEGGVSRFGETYIHPQNGQTYKMYNLPKRETLILVSGYSVELRTKIIDRWEELEAEQTKPKSLEEMSLLVITGLSAKVEEQRKALKEAQPKVEFHDAVVNGQDCYSMSEAVKLLNLDIGRNKFYTTLRADKVIMDDREPYQQYVEQGYFKLILKQVGHGGTEKVPLITGRGLSWLQRKYKHLQKEMV